MTTEDQEKRREERFQFEAPVLLLGGRGALRDISCSGIYFLVKQNLAPGGLVNFSIQLNYASPGKPVKLDCWGEILRVEALCEQFGVAASMNECWFTN